MDDPWGSPWATNDSNPTLEPPPRASTNLELPGRLLTRNRSSSSISPWAVEDNAFNDWAAADTGLALPQTAAANGSAWSGWGVDNGLNSSQTQLSVRTREGSLGQPSPSWPPAASPGLHPSKTVSRRSSSRSLSRQPTPDPWATEASANRLSLPAAVHIAAEQAVFSTLDSHDELEESELGKSLEDGAQSATEIEIEQAEARPGDMKADIGIKRKPNSNESADEQAGTGDLGNNEDDHTGSPSLSRHSSVSNGSRQEERLDSPITSMDEDTKDLPQTHRRSSTKVQDMVELFDGMAKRKDSNTLLVPDTNGARRRSSARSVSSIRSARTDDASEFGEFEDAEAFESAIPSRQPSVSGSRPTSRAGRLRSASKGSLRNAAAANAVIAAQSPIPEEPSKFEEIRAKFGWVTFKADVDLVDKLFDVGKLDKEQPPFKDYSLDTVEGIITDSFTAVSERKAWYRISRPGTMRKHDMGDDENYRRVTWAGSKVKEDATKIVRRWMQEDSYYSGPPKAGSRPKVRGGGFDWDSKNSKTEALSFDEIFGKRKSVQTPKLGTTQVPRPLSLQAPSHSRDSSVGVKSLPPRSPLSIPAPPIAPAFGWSTGGGGSGASTPVSVRPPSLLRQSIEVSSTRSESSRRPSVQEPEGRSSLQLPPPSARPLPESSRSTNIEQSFKKHGGNGDNEDDDNDDDDDDEWGEMVASPATDVRPPSSFFEGSLNGSLANLAFTSPASAAPNPDASTKSNTAPSGIELDTQISPEHRSQAPSATGVVDVWDFSAFDNTTIMPAIPPTTTSKPEFDFDTPLQSPTLSIPSRTSSPASLHTSKSPAPASSQSRSGSPAFEATRAPTPPGPSRPQHSAKSSFNLVRPSPLHHVLTPDLSSTDPVIPVNVPAKTVSFAEEGVDEAAIRRVVGGLPDLSYMLR
ncbi:hypothetical protein N0V82_009245 [Gnomoniopsis sp. IMI 355080]|nr:hypothetical protein N0V82_009245 [Gnomoniopsis sp. IMI 355080]